MSPTEALPLLVVAVLLLSASGVDPATMAVTFHGDHDATAFDGALIVAGGTVAVGPDADVTGPLYVVGGTLHVEGRVDGGVTLLAGNLTVTEGAAVAGELRTVGGQAVVADEASVGSRTTLEVTPRERTPGEQAGFLALQALALAAVAWLLARRHPDLLATVADAVTGHAAVSGVVGSIAGVTLLVLFVYMAFTLVLLPLSVAGLVAEALLVAYGYVVYGYLVGRRLPVERVEVATAAGAALFVVGVDVLGRIPLLGTVAQFLLVAVGLGAVLVTYFGLQRFEPATIPG